MLNEIEFKLYLTREQHKEFCKLLSTTVTSDFIDIIVNYQYHQVEVIINFPVRNLNLITAIIGFLNAQT